MIVGDLDGRSARRCTVDGGSRASLVYSDGFFAMRKIYVKNYVGTQCELTQMGFG